jgi:serralysin
MSTANTLERQMLNLINNERTSRGLDPLKLELRLNDAAEDHSDWMLRTENFSHTGIDGSSPGDRMRDAGFVFSGSWSWAENIAWQSERGAPGLSDDVVDLHNALMNSPGHRANILNPDVTVIGIGIETGIQNGFSAVMITQNFALTSAPLQIDAGEEIGDAGTSVEILFGSKFADTLLGDAGGDRLIGAGGNDKLYGHDGDDWLRGGSGNDKLFGGTGSDILKGGSGKDKLFGQEGNDILKGQGGADHFVFRAGYGEDTIKDFSDKDDVLDLRSFHLGSKSEAKSYASMVDGDTVFDFGDGDILILEDFNLSALDKGDFIF